MFETVKEQFDVRWFGARPPAVRPHRPLLRSGSVSLTEFYAVVEEGSGSDQGSIAWLRVYPRLYAVYRYNLDPVYPRGSDTMDALKGCPWTLEHASP